MANLVKNIKILLRAIAYGISYSNTFRGLFKKYSDPFMAKLSIGKGKNEISAY